MTAFRQISGLVCAQRPTISRQQGVRKSLTATRSKRWTALGATVVESISNPFYETARLLYEGNLGRGALSGDQGSVVMAGIVHPVTRETHRRRAAQPAATFWCAVPLQARARSAKRAFAGIDRWCCDGATVYSTAQVLANPVSSTAGSAYTNSSTCSILRLAAGGDTGPTIFPFGIRLLAPPARRASCSIGRVFHADTKLTWRQGLPQPPLAACRRTWQRTIAIAVVARIFPAWRSFAN